ncbi:hypothetical protein JI747_011965 [Chryseobacterium sp. RG1]|uniref:Fibronectin type-III domain-containing protein n=1 Tax=Chryseobacterium tagetis TaxID=2801334 RepID=A0ABS8A2A4_9FLAO|nr:hypothetical protein [Chryseobacterium tagetis]MCA6067900.1 hypothetical protein [Chryseobacterium tagetis]
MATAKCNISFRIDYTSSVPINSGILYYRVKNTTGSYTEFGIISVPSSGGLINIAGFQGSGEYDFIVKLITDKGTVEKVGTFTVGVCSPPVCEIPSIKKLYWETDDQLVMEYSVDANNLETPEYQIATDPHFENIIYFKVGFDYNPIEYINLSDLNIPDGTALYIRARKHCEPSGVSDWSNVVDFKWVNPAKAPYIFKAYCVSGLYEVPTNIAEFKASICWTEGLIKTVNLDTIEPGTGSFIYLNDGITPAIPGNLSDFDIPGGASSGFNDRGIAWIRFEEFKPSSIFNVDPETGRIGEISRYSCDS